MRPIIKLKNGLLNLAMAPFAGLEKRETQRRIQERIKHYSKKPLYKSVEVKH